MALHPVALLAVIEVGEHFSVAPPLFLVRNLFDVWAHRPPNHVFRYPVDFGLPRYFRLAFRGDPPSERFIRDPLVPLAQFLGSHERSSPLRGTDHALRAVLLLVYRLAEHALYGPPGRRRLPREQLRPDF